MAKTTAPKLWIQGQPKPDIAKIVSQFNANTESGFRAIRYFMEKLKSPLVPSNAERLQPYLDRFYQDLPTSAFK